MQSLTWKYPFGWARMCVLAALALAGCLPVQFGIEPRATTATEAPTRLAQVTTAASATTGAPPVSPAATETVPPAGSAVPAVPTITPVPTDPATPTAPPDPADTATSGPARTATHRPIPECVLTHTVRQGEGLLAIGVLYGVPWEDIADLNGIANPSLIFAGQVLCLPAGARLPNTPTPTPTATGTLTPTPTQSVTPGPTDTATPDPCEDPPAWFFTPAPPACPAEAAINSQAAAQRFERGQMLWVAEVDQYFVLFDGASQTAPGSMAYLPAPLSFKPGASPDNRIPETPPPGLEQPVSGFGLIWRGEVDGAESVRDALGWATQSEFGYATTYQCQAPVGAEWHCFLRAPNGQVLGLSFVPQQGYVWQPQ